MRRTGPPALLALEDGSIFRGEGFGAEGSCEGEVVFNTSLTGYQEILTDPSYKGQIVTMTAPLIGNYGINSEDAEAERAWIEGFVIRELSPIASNFRSQEDLHSYLVRSGVTAIEGVDTRALTKRIREKGALRGIVSTVERDPDTLVDKARNVPLMAGRNLVNEVTRRREAMWEEGASAAQFLPEPGAFEGPIFDLTVIDYGAKWNILRNLTSLGFRVRVVPADAELATVLSGGPDAVFLSNGPGDPSVLTHAQAVARGVIEKGVPLFGICLGHQIIAQALGGRTYKLPFGHHGGNHPVMDLTTNKVEITAQNHGFAVHEDLFADGTVEMTHKSLNADTVEGLRHTTLPVMSVQHHPEAAPGPHDSLYLFRRFRDELINLTR